MKRLAQTLILAALAALLLAACGAFSLDSFGGVGASCSGDAACKSGLRCESGTCQLFGADGDSQENELDLDGRDGDSQEQAEPENEAESDADTEQAGDVEAEAENADGDPTDSEPIESETEREPDALPEGDGDIEGEAAEGDATDLDSELPEADDDSESESNLTNGFVRINAGTFTMGSPSGEEGRYSWETQHQVTLTYNFEMKTTEVTQGEFNTLMGYSPSNFTACGTTCPVEMVDWHEACAYANALSVQKGYTQCFDCTGSGASISCSLKSAYTKPQDCPGFRLPTEAEWEYAARAGTTTATYNGNLTVTDCTSDPALAPIAWYCFNAGSTTHPVGLKTPNNWGLYDMSGNVWEWGWDWWDGSADYGSGSVTDPTGQSTGSRRVARGGYWYYYAQLARSASRGNGSPSDRNNGIGFRLVRSLPSAVLDGDPDPDLDADPDTPPCTAGPCCNGGVAVVAGQPCLSGADALACTNDVCDAAGACTHPLKALNCLIDGACYTHNQDNPTNACEYCVSNVAPTSWIKKAKGTGCNDGFDCTYDDQCDTGVCKGKDLSCTNDPGPCGAIKTCNGSKDCTVTYPDTTVSCNDDNLCTSKDVCNGLGGCGGTPYTCNASNPGTCETTSSSTCNGDGTCTYTYAANTGGACDDQNACTSGDICAADKSCAGTAYSCNGTHGACNGTGGCKCDPAYSGNHCELCAPGAFGSYPDCYLPSASYCQNNACFAVPPTNQTLCYNDSSPTSCVGQPGTDACGTTLYCGQDAQYDTGWRSFTCLDVTGTTLAACPADITYGEVVKDSATGLSWQRAITSSVTWDEAQTACAPSYAGLSDWRLPSPQELQSLIDDGGAADNPSLVAFAGQLGKFYWSSRELAGDTTRAWLVGGFIGAYPKTTPQALRCVRGGPKVSSVGAPSNTERFAFHTGAGLSGDLLVYDLLSGLVWQAAPNADTLNWSQAMASCESSTSGGHKDWRLADKKELLSLVNYGRTNPATSFPGSSSFKHFWTSTSEVSPGIAAWIVNFLDGSVSTSAKTTAYASLCVRGGVSNSFVPIKAGTFTMGSPAGEVGRSTNETQHQVTLTYSFEMAKYEITQGEFNALMGYNPSRFTTCGTNCPVEQVTWHEALAYTNVLSSQKGYAQCFDCTGTQASISCTLKTTYSRPQDCPGFRLPTEAEWEYAARAGSSTALYNGPLLYSGDLGGDDTNLDQIGWYWGNDHTTTKPVGRKLANAWGLYDMSGNAWEWGWDLYVGGLSDYDSGSAIDPTGSSTGSNRVIRGGSWQDAARVCRSAYRNAGPTSRDYLNSASFRPVRSLNPKQPGFTPIPAGTFTMGSPSTEAGRNTDETQHAVTLTYAFEMKTTETTQADWTAAFPGTNPSWFGPNADGADCGTNCPVERVNWYEALAYANKLSEKSGLPPCYTLSACSGTIGGGCATNENFCVTGAYTCTVALNGAAKPQDCEGYRLPTEAEWEYAARAGSTTAFYPSSGNNGTITNTLGQDTNLDKIAWYSYNSVNTTHAVGGKAANAWGLYDLLGNVYEWAWDWDGAYPGAVNDPTGATASTGREIRGGSWSGTPQGSRTALRGLYAPAERNRLIGFRLVRTLNPPTAGYTRIKAGTFTMGSPASEATRYANETQHAVTLTYNFEMKATEVTQAEFTAFAGTNLSYFSTNGGGSTCGTNCPVEQVNWYEALAYANWLSTQKGLTPCYVLANCSGTLGGACSNHQANCTSGTYTCTVALNGVSKPQDCTGFRLPTEAEWEYAARAGTTTATYNGDITRLACEKSPIDPNLSPIAWFCANSNSTTQPVGIKIPNAWGLYDMSGNVWEWAWDGYDGTSDYGAGSVTDPTGQSAAANRVFRGGSWYTYAEHARSAIRSYTVPGYRGKELGFRLVRSLF